MLRAPVVTDHAVSRYIERVKPCCDRSVARGEILALCRAAGEPSKDAPGWKPPSLEESLYLEVAPGIAFVFQDGKMTTVLTRGSESPEHRQARKDARKRKREEREIRRRMAERPRKGGSKGWEEAA